MKKLILLLLFFASFSSMAQTSGSEVLSFYNCTSPTTDSGGVVIKTKLPFGSPRFMPTMVIEGYNFGLAQTVGLTVNFYVYNGGSGEYFHSPAVSSHGGYAPDVYLFNDAGFVSLFLKRGLSQYCLGFKIRSWLRTPTDGGATSDWFTGWTAVTVNTPPTATNNYVKVEYQNSMGALKTSAEADINGLKVGLRKGPFNLGLGFATFNALTTGNYNTAIGTYSLTKATIGHYNTSVGNYALAESIGGEGSVAVGSEAMRGYGINNVNTLSTAIGWRALRGNLTTPSNNTAVGNTAIGSDALFSNEIGTHNVGIGVYALSRNTKGNNNVAIGTSALLENIAKSNNTAVGIQSQAYLGNNSTEESTNNSSFGVFSLRGSETRANNTGKMNNAFGAYSLLLNTSGEQQSAFGFTTLYNSTGHYNSAFGSYAGYDLTTGTTNTIVGQNTGRGITTGSGNTIIGAGITGLSTSLTNTVIIGASALERIRIDQNGNMGIGTSNPTEKLTVAGDISALLRVAFQDNARFTVTNTNVPTLNTASFSMPHYGLSAPNAGGSADLWISGSQAIRMFNAGNPVPSFNLVGGNLGLGTQTIPAGYKLAVKGNLIAEKIVVKTSTNWPDFVFKKDYKLPSLNEVEQFISKNSHLPEIPSAREVESKGQDVGEMNRLLLKKVEEITLYLIELKKENQEMKKEIQDLKGKK
jgi:hypothetical protein